MAFWKLQALFTPETLNLLVIDGPALYPQQLSDLAVAISTVLLGQTDHGEPELFLIILLSSFVLQGRTAETNNTAGPTL